MISVSWLKLRSTSTLILSLTYEDSSSSYYYKWHSYSPRMNSVETSIICSHKDFRLNGRLWIEDRIKDYFSIVSFNISFNSLLRQRILIKVWSSFKNLIVKTYLINIIKHLTIRFKKLLPKLISAGNSSQVSAKNSWVWVHVSDLLQCLKNYIKLSNNLMVSLQIPYKFLINQSSSFQILIIQFN